MAYRTTQELIEDLEKNGHLIRITEEVDPDLEMAAIHLRVFANKGPAILFENIKGSPFRAVSNLFGTEERCRFIFRDTFTKVQQLIALKTNPTKALKNPFRYLSLGLFALNAIPKKTRISNSHFQETTINQLPLIKSWPNDGGAFITLPQVYSENQNKPGIMNSNLGMYRIQLSGNDFEPNKEIGLHYQIHRGIGIHQSIANKQGKPLKVSIFIGGNPANTVAAVMPMPEGMTELTFAGALGGNRFKYAYKNGYCLSVDADFIITGEVFPNTTKPEGPFGDHLGYYSLKHPFPVLKVHKVYHRKNALFPFTVVGRPPQEDTQFGSLIHALSGAAIPTEIPGVHEVNAVDAAGVHPLLLAIGSERYTPYLKTKVPQEVLTQANALLGFGQLSLAKYLIISNKEDNPELTCKDEEAFFKHILERVDWKRDLHFQTKTTIDTLDYSGETINQGSKLVIAAVGEKIRTLESIIPTNLEIPSGFLDPNVVFDGVLVLSAPSFKSYEQTKTEINDFALFMENQPLQGFPLIIITDNSLFVANTSHTPPTPIKQPKKNIHNWLWTTFTRSNPSHDIYGIQSFVEHKHWGCNGSLIIDTRIKPHHAPPLIADDFTEKKVDKMGEKGGCLYGIIE